MRDSERGGKNKNDTSLRDLRRTGSGNASEQETKLVYVTRATRGYQKLRFLSRFKR